RMRQNSDSAFIVYPIDEFLHRRKAQPPADSISENMNRAALEGEFEARNDEERCVGQPLTELDVFFHSPLVEDFGVIAHSGETHPRHLENLDQAIERFFAV